MNEIINKGFYTPPYQNNKTPYDNGFNNINLNSNFDNYTQEQIHNIRNKYLYLKNKISQPTGFAASMDIDQLAQQLGLTSFGMQISQLPQLNQPPQQVQKTQPQPKKQGLFGYKNPLTGDSRIFTREDIGAMNKDEFSQNEKAIYAQNKEFDGFMPSNGDLEHEALTGGGVVKVNSYTHADGTQVKGYYRSKPEF